MENVENSNTVLLSNEYLDPDDVGLRDSPPPKPMEVNLQPSPSPPPAHSVPPDSPEPSPDPPDLRKHHPSYHEAYLISSMSGGQHEDITRAAREKPLASDDEVEEEETEANPEKNGIGLAAEALSQALKSPLEPTQKKATSLDIPSAPSITTSYADGSCPQSSPDTTIKVSDPPTAEKLPPIRQHSPQSALPNGNGSAQITLPSLSDQLGSINQLTRAASAKDSTFPQSPLARPSSAALNPYRLLPLPHSSFIDHSSSSKETPSTDQSDSTSTIDRMSVKGIASPPMDGFQCTFPGCTVQPFQTQCLLNSHANVHSSNRPHYCSVKGCPRSEGGKGFKRKNEMIRHGLVHDSPGYVCPFCPNKEHKYPRPDNLQRHVRVHHVDKDKDDPQVREVLSQRSERPSRGRWRRRGTS